MRIVLLVAAVLLAGCAGPSTADLDAANARRICLGNQHQVGTAAFDACFTETFRSISLGRISR
jgi:hypothetical protein